MLNDNIHLQQAKLNEEAAIENQKSYPEWAIVMCFYAALHYIEYYAVSKQQNIYALYPDSESKKFSQHERRIRYVEDISSDKNSPDLSIAYERLYEASMKARYLKNLNTTSRRYFKIGCEFYFKALDTVKDSLSL
ncbi:MAG TPA: hypothetical protein DD379_09165 [Cyanobacteria bacterium UBA11162]|nr:hypothetical protein [Cyanobacteria bacterium UBA11162]